MITQFCDAVNSQNKLCELYLNIIFLFVYFSQNRLHNRLLLVKFFNSVYTEIDSSMRFRKRFQRSYERKKEYNV